MQGVLTRRRFLGLSGALGGAAALGALGSPARAAEHADPARRATWPSTLDLPDGFHPGGIAIGDLPFAYFGSLLGAAVYRVNLATGQGAMIYPGVDQGTFDPAYMAVGMRVDHLGRLFVAGGWGDAIRVHDAFTGEVLKSYAVGTANTAVYGVTLSRWGAWFTDGFNALLYGVPFGPGGRLPDQDSVITLPLTGDWVQGDSGPTASGIVWSPDGSALLVANVAADGGSLFRVDPATGVARRVDLGGYLLPTTLGLTIVGRTLYATPQQNGVAELVVNPAGTSGALLRQISDPRFDAPSAGAVYRDRMYLVNSRFPLAPTPTTPYNAVAIPLR